jgi:glucose/arabinose dehydrogenase
VLPRLTGLSIAVLAAACGSSPSSLTQGAPTASGTSASATACSLGQQESPGGDIAAGSVTGLAFAPDGRLFYAERSGTVRVWQNGAAHVFASVPTVTSERGGGYSERGLLGLALSPSFASDHFVYAFFSDRDDAHQHVVRWTDCAGSASAPTVLITLPSGSDCCHKGGRIGFGADGKLYVTLGDEHDAVAAQNTADPRGKILRFNPDGTVPGDNPFGATNPVWAYGLRNPFGLAFSASGQLAVTNNGPTGDSGSPSTGYDTLILSVARGARYQWPNCFGYSHPLLASSCGARALPPDWSSEAATVVPTGAAFVSASAPQPYAGHLVFCTLDRGMLVASPGSPHAAVARGPSGCRLAVVEGPDHALYFSDLTAIHRLG